MLETILLITSLVISAVSVYVSLTREQPKPDSNFDGPTAEEGRPFGRIAGLNRVKINTDGFVQTKTEAVESDGK